jgi:hypothetical protein
VRIRSLIHLLEAVHSLVRPERIVILGSSSLLSVEPRLGETGQPLEFSYDADLLVSPLDHEQARILIESLGQESFFAKRHGYYADILRPEITETLPEGWSSRLVHVPGSSGSFAVNPLDLALVKLILGRPKDMLLLRDLLGSGIVAADALRLHYLSAQLSEADAASAGRNLHALLSTSGE